MTTTMTTFLADSSIWIDHLRRSSSLLLRVMDGDDAAHTEPVAMEVLSGARDRTQFDRLQRMLLGTPLVQFDSAADFGAATELRRSALHDSLRVGIVDCMIIAVAGRTQVPLLTRDRGQAQLARLHGITTTLLTD